MMRKGTFVCLLAMMLAVNATVYFQEEFDKKWDSRWVQSDDKKSDGTAGKFKLTAGKWYGDKNADKGLQTSQDARFYRLSAKMGESFSNEGKDLVLQYTVKHEQKIDCGGAYIKLHPATLDQKAYNGDSEYAIMFGPDVCGSSRRTHFIVNHDGENYLIEKDIPLAVDQLTHVYTLVLHADKTFEIYVDGEEKRAGNLYDDFAILEPREIPDPDEKKPESWDEREFIDDPEDVKPAGYDDIPPMIADPEAEEPEDWDEEEDGEWDAPMIPNPDYEGPWSARQIKNPDYQGKWAPQQIANPDFEDDESIGVFADLGAVGFELWQVKAGTIFDNVFVGDSLEEAQAFAAATTEKSRDAEKEMFDEAEAKRRAEEEAARAAAEAAAAEDDDDDDEDEDEDEDEDDAASKKAAAKAAKKKQDKAKERKAKIEQLKKKVKKDKVGHDEL